MLCTRIEIQGNLASGLSGLSGLITLLIRITVSLFETFLTLDVDYRTNRGYSFGGFGVVA